MHNVYLERGEVGRRSGAQRSTPPPNALPPHLKALIALAEGQNSSVVVNELAKLATYESVASDSPVPPGSVVSPALTYYGP